MSIIKKIGRFIGSMRFAIALLVVLALACTAGSLVTQGQTYEWYAARYSERTAALIVALRLDDAFHSAWFIAISAFLCLNLTLCNVVRLPALVRRTRRENTLAGALDGASTVAVEGVADPEAVFRRLGFPHPRREQTAGVEALFASRRRAGLWGAWVCHLGILLLILGFGLGQMTQRQYTVYGLPGQTRAIGDTGLMLTIDDFTVGLREDDTVEQYTAAITVGDPARGAVESAEISVNNPATLFGMKFYQNSTGWGADVHIEKDGAPLQDESVCAGEYVRVADKPELVILLNAFYPDYQLVPGAGPSTVSGQLNNPAYLYTVYYQGQILGMNALMQGEVLTIDEYAVTFENPRSYTLIQVKRDRFTWLALAGALVVLAGLALAFYVQPEKVWAVRDGENGAWTVFGLSRKGGAMFRERFARAVEESKEGNDDAAG